MQKFESVFVFVVVILLLFSVGVEGVTLAKSSTTTCRTGSGLTGAVYRQSVTELVSTGKNHQQYQDQLPSEVNFFPSHEQ